MGNLCGTPAADEDEELSPLEEKLVEKLKIRSKDRTNPIKHLNTLIMKFGRIGKAFESLRDVYAATDTDGNGTIDMGEFTEGAKRMGYTLGEEEKKEIFEAADIDGNRDIDFKEFIVMCALLHVLEGESKADAPAAPGELAKNVKEAFELAIDSFLFLDVNCSGLLDKDEVLAALNAKGGAGGNALMLKRFEEMDWDRSGQISFMEFLFALEDWVGIENEDD